MAIDTSYSVAQPQVGNAQGAGNAGATSGTTPAPVATRGDLQGAQGATYSSSSKVFMEAPKIDSATMMLMMTQIQSKLADAHATLANEDIKGTQKDMKDLHEQRIAKMQEYWDKMSKSEGGGFFGSLFKALKCLFTGDFKGMADNLEKAFKEDITTALISIFVVGFCSMTMGPFAPLVAAAILTPWMMGDKELMGEFADMMGLDADAKKDFIDATHWIGFAAEIVIDIAISVAVSVATFGAAAPAMVAFLVGKAVLIAARETERGVRSYQQTEAQSEGLESYADADRLQAEANERQMSINKMMDNLQDNYDSFANIIKDTADMLIKNYQAQQAAASAV